MDRERMIGRIQRSLILTVAALILFSGVIEVWAQNGPSGMNELVVIEKQTGPNRVVIEDDEFQLTPDAKILDEKGRPTRLERVSFPTEALVGLSAAGRGTWKIHFIQIKRMPH